jgi:hypothetical protein
LEEERPVDADLGGAGVLAAGFGDEAVRDLDVEVEGGLVAAECPERVGDSGGGDAGEERVVAAVGGGDGAVGGEPGELGLAEFAEDPPTGRSSATGLSRRSWMSDRATTG